MMNLKPNTKFCVLILIIINIVLVESCAFTPANQMPPDSNITERFPKATRPPDPASITPSPTPPLGSTLNPLIFGFVITESLEIDEEALAQLVSLLSTESNQNIYVEYYNSYEPLISDIQDGTVHITWLPPQILITLENQRFIKPVLLSNHFGVYQYSTQILANIDQGYQSYYDPILNQSTETAAVALAQLDGLRPCWVDSDSISGYLLPAAIFRENDIELAEGVITKNPSSTIRALIIGGICDFGATYGGNGDPRTASSLADIPDVMEKIEIIWRSDPIIPNYTIAFHSDIPDSIQLELKKSFQTISNSLDGYQLFSAALGYEINGFEPCGPSTFEPLRKLLDVLNANPESAVDDPLEE